MTESEGVVKYQLDYTPGPLPGDADLGPLFDWFARCRALGLIGRDPLRYDGVAYGNISLRAQPGFLISGTQTGGQPSLAPTDLSWVRDFDIDRNRLEAGGPARPSSEAMTHGQIYRALSGVNAVIHVHCPTIWRLARELGLPLTAASAAYGTPEIAAEVDRLLTLRAAAPPGLFAMGGHEDGVVAYAADMEGAGRLLLATLADAQRLTAIDDG